QEITMDRRYRRWIARHVIGDGYGKCREVTEAMAAAFPELERVRGHYVCPQVGEREHWWCETRDGDVVDPTAAQFPSGGDGTYLPWSEGQPEPVGKCRCCGGYVFIQSKWAPSLCSAACAVEMLAYLEKEASEDRDSRVCACSIPPPAHGQRTRRPANTHARCSARRRALSGHASSPVSALRGSVRWPARRLRFPSSPYRSGAPGSLRSATMGR